MAGINKNFDLSWTGAAGAPVDVYFNGGFVTNTLNDGSYTNATNEKGGGTDTHQVCNAGTKVCSNIASTVW